MGEPASYTVRPVSGTGTLVSIVPVLLFCGIGLAAAGERGAIWGALGFLLFRLIVVRKGVLKDHARGVALTRKGDFEQALACFVQSEAVWNERPFLDRHRALILGSAVRYPFLFLSIFNQAYCLARLGRKPEAMERLAVLDGMDPDSQLVKGLRDLLEA